MAWLFNPSGWQSTRGLAPLDFRNIASDIQYPGGDVVYAGNYIRTAGAVQYQAASLPGTVFTVTGGSWSGGIATVTVGPHKMVAGQLVTVAGATPSGYNVVKVQVTSAGATTISYAVAASLAGWSSGGTVTVGGTLASGMMAIDGYGVPQIYFSGAWSAISALAQTPWGQDINAAAHNLLACASITLTPGTLPANAAGKLAVDASFKLWVNSGSGWVAAGLQDSGANGLLKRTSLNTTTVATPGNAGDYYAPGYALLAADLPVFMASGATHAEGAVPDPGPAAGSLRFLCENSTWAVPAGSVGGGGLADPGNNGLVLRTALNVTRVAATSDVYMPGNPIGTGDLPRMAASGPGHSPGIVPDPGAMAGSARFLCENGSWLSPTITALQGYAVAATAPVDTQVLAWSAANNCWQPTAAGGASANASQLQGYNISSTAPAINQALAWNGSAWTPSAAASSLMMRATDYQFSQTPTSGNLGVGLNTITLPGSVPLGLNGSDVAHYFLISGGGGTPEAVCITGGNAVEGAAAGATLSFSCAHTHTGAWTISSSSGGIHEALQHGKTAGVPFCVAVTQNTTVYATITIGGVSNFSLVGIGNPTISLNYSASGPGSGPVSCLSVLGYGQGAPTNFSSDYGTFATRHSTITPSFQVASASGFSVGGYGMLGYSSAQAYYGGTQTYELYQIVKIKSIVGTTITPYEAIRIPLAAAGYGVAPATLAQNVCISGLTFDGISATGTIGYNGIYATGLANSRLENLNFKNFGPTSGIYGSTGIYSNLCYRTRFSGLTFDGCGNGAAASFISYHESFCIYSDINITNSNFGMLWIEGLGHQVTNLISGGSAGRSIKLMGVCWSNFVNVDGSDAANGETGLSIQLGCYRNQFDNVISTACTSNGVHFQGSQNVYNTMNNVQAFGNGGADIVFNATDAYNLVTNAQYGSISDAGVGNIVESSAPGTGYSPWTPIAGDTWGTDLGSGDAPSSYRKNSRGEVFVRYARSGSAGPANTTVVGVLPVGYRPAAIVIFPMAGSTGAAGVAAQFQVLPNGSIAVFNAAGCLYISGGFSFATF
jgi:hypothetical protein